MAASKVISGAADNPHGMLLSDTAESEVIPAEAQGFAASAIAALAAILMALAPIATRIAPMQKGWWVEPKTWPLLCLAVTLLAAGFQALRWWLTYRLSEDRAGFRARSLWAFGGLAPAFEYAFYFCIYLFAVGYLGFAISSFLFMQFVVWRAGLRSWKWRLAAALFVVALVLAFRIGIQLWFPMAPLFEYAPDWFIQNIAIYL